MSFAYQVLVTIHVAIGFLSLILFGFRLLQRKAARCIFALATGTLKPCILLALAL